VAGEYDRAKSFIEEWGKIAPEIPEIVQRFSDLPTEIFPLYKIQ